MLDPSEEGGGGVAVTNGAVGVGAAFEVAVTVAEPLT